MHGINIYNVLKALPFELEIYNVGNIDSIGNVIFQAGNKRFASTHCTFLFHGVTSSPSTEPMGELTLNERLNSVRADQARITKVLEETTKMGHAEIEDLFLHSETKTAENALEEGIVDKIRDPQIPDGIEFNAFNFPK